MEKNLLLPNKYQKKSKNTYVFTTVHNLVYVVYFEEEVQDYFKINFPNISNRIYEFGFLPLNIKISEVNQYPVDERITVTVVKLLIKYFEQYQNAIIYNCLSNDGKQGVRAGQIIKF